MTVKPTETLANPPPPAQRWPGWPGDNVFRLLVPVVKVGGIIGKGGEIIKKICDETGARVRILDGPLGHPERVVLISGKEEPEAEVSPAMDAVFRVFKRINSISNDGKTITESGSCSVRLLMASVQAIHLIGKKGSSIKSIQEESGASINVLTVDERAHYASGDERIVEIQGEHLKVHKALEAVVRHIRKFLVDHSMLPIFEKSSKSVTVDPVSDAWSNQQQSMLHSPQQTGISHDNPLSLRRDALLFERERQRDLQLRHSELSPYRQDPTLPVSRYPALGRLTTDLVTQVTQTMQIPLRYAKDLVGSDGGNIAYIRGRSGAGVSIQESGKYDIVVEIKGTPTEVQTAQQLIEDSLSQHKEPVPSVYGGLDPRSGPSFSRLTETAYPSSSLGTEPYGGYGSLARSEAGFSELADRAYPSSSLATRAYGGFGSPGFGGYSSYKY